MVNRNLRRKIFGTWGKTNLPELSKELSRKTGRREKLFLKSLDDWPNEFAFHLLVHHAIDVVACARELLKNPVIASRFKTLTGIELTPRLIDRILVIIFLHDLGKVGAGYQDQIFEGKSGNTGHVQPWLAALYSWESPQKVKIFDILDIPSMQGWFCAKNIAGDKNSDQNALYTMLAVSTSHHGGRKSVSEIKKYQLSELDRESAIGIHPMDALSDLAGEIKTLLPNAWADAPPIPIASTFIRWFSGLVMTSDWMASDSRKDRFPYWNGDGTAEDRMVFATLRAEAMMRDIGMPMAKVLGTPHPLSALRDEKGRLLEPRQIQSAILKIPEDQRFILIEAPTGEGKTEAAVIRFLMLLLSGSVDSLFFAVPTRGASKDLFLRIKKDLSWTIPEIDQRITAAMGGKDTRNIYGDGTDIPWAAGHPARFMAAPVALGTIDQAYLGIMSVKHADLRSFLLSRSLLVIDEVHAADPFMTELTRALVHRHLDAGGHVLLMSATLGSSARHRISNRDRRNKAPSFDDACDEPYPQIRYGVDNLDTPVVKNKESKITSFRPKPVELRISTFSGAINQAKEAADAGARVLIIRSTVKDAIETQEALLAMGVKTFSVDGKETIHHSKFVQKDRDRLDDELRAVIGKESLVRKPGNGIVCVTTQTGEQSLDLNADLLITDPCHVDVFLQRLGREHRHEGPRPVGYETALCIVLDPGDIKQYIVTDSNKISMGRPGLGFAYIYKNLLSVEALMEWIRNKKKITVPDDNRLLVELGTHKDRLKETAIGMGDLWETHRKALYVKEDKDSDRSRGGILDKNLSFLTHPESFVSEEKLSTRLGEEKVSIKCEPFPSMFSGEVDEMDITLDEAMAALNKEQSIDKLKGVIESSTEEKTLVRIGLSLYSYTRHGLLEVK